MIANRIPQHLDEPERILIFTPDEVILCSVVLVGFFAAGMMLWGMVGSVVVYVVYGKYRAGLSVRRMMARVYWTLPVSMIGFRRCPDSSIREWVG